MLILKKLSKFSVPPEDMVHIYIRSIAEQSSVVWSSSLTKGEEYDIERIQKVALRIIFTDEYTTYEHALNLTTLPTLKTRRSKLCFNFALKCTKSPKTADMFPLRDSNANPRNPEKFEVGLHRNLQALTKNLPGRRFLVLVPGSSKFQVIGTWLGT